MISAENLPAWIQALGSILAILAAIYIGHRNHKHSERVFEEERNREEGIRHLRAHGLAHALYPDLLEVKAKMNASEAAISHQLAQRDFQRHRQDITQDWEIYIPEGFGSAGELFYLLGNDTAPVVSELLSLLHQHNRAASELIARLYDGSTSDAAWGIFQNNGIFANRLTLMNQDVEEAIDLVGKIRDRELLPKYALEAKNDQQDNVVPDSAATYPDG